jgi:hypothetical protein
MGSSSYLRDLGICSDSSGIGKAEEIFLRIVPDIRLVKGASSDFVADTMGAVRKMELNNSTRGALFEFTIGVALIAAGIKPFYRQAEITYVANAIFDYVLWRDNVLPITLSLKTSLRERWKQAELEASALKDVHKNSQNYLITLDAIEVARRRSASRLSDNYSFLDRYIVADTAEFDELVKYLQSGTYGLPSDVNPMRISKVVG